MPKSYAARLARGRYYSHLGWTSRGAAYASETARGQMSRMQNYFSKAEVDLQEALTLKPELSVAYATLIEMAMAYGSRKSIEDLVKKALQIDPYSFEVRSSYIFSLQPKWGGSLNQMRAAVNGAEQYLAKNPGLTALRGYIHYTEADILKSSGKRHQAIELLNRAVQSAKHWRFVYERGEQHYWLREYDKALADFNESLKMWPQHPWPLKLGRGSMGNRATPTWP